MSADNWAECPLCKAKKALALKSLEDQYGKVSHEEYEKLREGLDNVSKEDSDEEDSLREDHEQGVDTNGCCYVIYSGVCSDCGASWQFRKDDIMPKDPADIELVEKLNGLR